MKTSWLLALVLAPALTWAGSPLQLRSSHPSFPMNASDSLERGRLSGTVRVKGIPRRLPPLRVYKHKDFCGSQVPDESLIVNREGQLQNVVVTMHAMPSRNIILDLPRREITLDNERCRFVPHVQAAPVGTTLLLSNSDSILHDAHAFMGADTLFNEGLPTWRTVRKTLPRPGVVRILCELHRAWMSAYVVVTSTPYIAVTDRQGDFFIDNIPGGAYSVRFWHERLGELSKPVVIEPGRISEVELSFPCPVCR